MKSGVRPFSEQLLIVAQKRPAGRKSSSGCFARSSAETVMHETDFPGRKADEVETKKKMASMDTERAVNAVKSELATVKAGCH